MISVHNVEMHLHLSLSRSREDITIASLTGLRSKELSSVRRDCITYITLARASDIDIQS